MRRLDQPLVLGDAEIDSYSCYERGDVLYLSVGQRAASPRRTWTSRCMLERDGTLNVTLPRRGLAARWPHELVEPLLHETLSYA